MTINGQVLAVNIALIPIYWFFLFKRLPSDDFGVIDIYQTCIIFPILITIDCFISRVVVPYQHLLLIPIYLSPYFLVAYFFSHAQYPAYDNLNFKNANTLYLILGIALIILIVHLFLSTYTLIRYYCLDGSSIDWDLENGEVYDEDKIDAGRLSINDPPKGGTNTSHSGDNSSIDLSIEDSDFSDRFVKQEKIATQTDKDDQKSEESKSKK